MVLMQRGQLLARYGYLKDRLDNLLNPSFTPEHLMERLISQNDTITHEELHLLLRHPVIDALFPKLIWQNGAGDMGLLDPDQMALVDMNGRLYLVDDEIRLVHPYQLFKAGILVEWQAYLNEKQISQPIKQAFRELYFLTPHEFNTYRINRFMGKCVKGSILAPILIERGWQIDKDKAHHHAMKQVGDICAMFAFEDVVFYLGYDLPQPITASSIQFTVNHAQSTPLLDDIFPIILSEILHDATTAITVANWRKFEAENSA